MVVHQLNCCNVYRVKINNEDLYTLNINFCFLNSKAVSIVRIFCNTINGVGPLAINVYLIPCHTTIIN